MDGINRINKTTFRFLGGKLHDYDTVSRTKTLVLAVPT